MNRGVNGNDALETINAAASLIASAENQNRVPQVSVKKKRWKSYWRHFWCFGSQKNKQRIGHAVLVPETPTTGADAPTAENPPQPLPIVLPFVAPPSSPASFPPSEPPSAAQSPTGLLSLTSISANMYSPGDRSSIFAIGPYAHETQLVSPPVFSTFTTEPSTAPYTPPPESLHLTTPSSPEVPFARLLEPSFQGGEVGQRYPLSQYEFQSYQLQPGSPLSHLISPRSGISGSGTSSPFPDLECAPGHPFFVEFKNGNHTKFLNLDKIMLREWESFHGSGALTPDTRSKCHDSFLLNSQGSDIIPLPDECNGLQNDENELNHRVSFEITSEEVVRCVEKNPAASSEVVPESAENIERTGEENPRDMTYVNENPAGVATNITSDKNPTQGEDEKKHQKNRTVTLGSSKEFNFDNIDGENSDNPNVGSSNWWANEKVLVEDGGPSKIWSFPMIQTSVS